MASQDDHLKENLDSEKTIPADVGEATAMPGTRILVVDDVGYIRIILKRHLTSQGYGVDEAAWGKEAIEFLKRKRYDLVIIDRNLPDIDGLQVCHEVVSGNGLGTDPHTPAPKIIMLTARGGIDDRIRGLDEGADDYLVKPFSLRELGARVRALLRRDTATGNSLITAGGIEMDTARHEVTYRGDSVDLTVKEFALLRWFLLHPDEVHSAERLLEHVWDEHADPFTNTVRVTLSNVRKKLADAHPEASPIETITGSGYRLPST